MVISNFLMELIIIIIIIIIINNNNNINNNDNNNINNNDNNDNNCSNHSKYKHSVNKIFFVGRCYFLIFLHKTFGIYMCFPFWFLYRWLTTHFEKLFARSAALCTS
jgi:hypothetical protein